MRKMFVSDDTICAYQSEQKKQILTISTIGFRRAMTRQRNARISTDRSQQTIGNVKIAFPGFNQRRADPAKRFNRVSVQCVTNHSTAPSRFFNEYMTIEKEKAAQTGRWILNVISAQEAYQNDWNVSEQQVPNKTKHSLQSRKSSRVEPVENSTGRCFHVPLPQTQMRPSQNQLLPQPQFISTATENTRAHRLSELSDMTSIEDVHTTNISDQTSHIKSVDYSTDDFENDACISKRMLIIFSVIGAIVVGAIIIGVFVTVFVAGK
ncbi:unnamed protein product [Adineta ricciae]|uniref:Uncharacterized protein n=1 Tax=Adineta ricciae TaxID=249248 RepID=A0A814AQC5_ADIRI|nr:unnamed protein product [Adineta ricciae]